MKELVDELSRRLNGDLPGESAHKLMMSYKRETAQEVRKSRSNARLSAVSLNLFLKDNVWRTVFILRQAYDGVHSNQVSFPGGRIEVGESARQAALRETFEEVGADPSETIVLGELSELYIPPSNFLVRPFVTIFRSEPSWVAQEREVQLIMTPRVADFMNEAIITQKEVELRQYNTSILVPTFEVEGHTVWGATAMMWREFMEVARGLF